VQKLKKQAVPVLTENQVRDLEESVISEVIEMYHATAEMVKQFNSHFSDKILLETLFNIFLSLLFTY